MTDDDYTLRLDWSATRLRTAVKLLGRFAKGTWPNSAATELGDYLKPWEDYEGPQAIRLNWRPAKVHAVCRSLSEAAYLLENERIQPVGARREDQEILLELAEVYGALRDIASFRHQAIVAVATPAVRSG